MSKKLVALAALSVLAALAITAAGCTGGREDSASPPTATAGSTADGAAGQAVAVETAGEPEAAPVAADASSLPAVGPKVIQTSSLRLVVPRGRFDEAIGRARTIAAGLGGFVASSSATQGGEGRLVRGTLVVRVPGERYADAMTQLSRLGKVEGREESGQDVSAQFVDLEARARHLEAVERQLLELLSRAETVPAALEVQSQLNGVQLELEQVRGQLRYLDDGVSFATISLDVREQPVATVAGKDDGDSWGIVEAWSDAGRGFVHVASGMFVGLATAAPVLLLVAAALIGVRLAWRFRRRASTPAERTS